MGKKVHSDAGLLYLQKIGFDRIRGKYGIYKRLTDVYGKPKADELFSQYDRIQGASEIGSPKYYDLIHSDAELSKAITEAHDSDFIRKAINYLDKHADFVGKTILEVGCGTGYFTGYLADAFPESKIVAIDRCQAALEIAKERIHKLGACNVEFLNSDVFDIDQEFDTIVSLRILNDVIDHEQKPFCGDNISDQFEDCTEIFAEYAEKIKGLLTENGTLISIEKLERDPMLYGWLSSLNKSNCGLLTETFESLDCEVKEEPTEFQAIACQNNTALEIHELFAIWFNALGVYNISGRSELDGLQAIIYFSDNAGEKIRDTFIVDEGGVKVGRLALYYDKDDKDYVLFLGVISGGNSAVYLIPAEEIDAVQEHINESIEMNKANGCSIEEC